MSQEKKHLFLFTIGPVQSFIYQARKTQDLYAGSQLLCELVREAAQELKKQCPNVEFVFPHGGVISHKDASVPNRFLAVIDMDARKLGEELEKHIRKHYKDLANDTLQKCYPSQTINGFNKQIDDFLDIYWAAVNYDENNYKKQYAQIENLLGATKNTRYFNQLEEVGRKSSLSGERNVLFYNYDASKRFKNSFLQGFDTGVIEAQDWRSSSYRDKFRIGYGEGLCAVDLVKRLYRNVTFPSVACIASGPAISEVEKDKLESYQNFIERHLEIRFDCQFYYKENLTEKYFENNYGKDTAKLFIKHKDNLETHFVKLCKLDDLKISKYYATLRFDGDKMGEWMSGKHLGKNDGNTLKDFQNIFSKLLGDFAEDARKIIRGNGETVYAGGDDFLGFVSLEHLFKVLKELRETFDTTINTVLQSPENQQKYGITEDFTFSAGIVIAQYKHPLGDVLQWAKKMEKKAKSEQGGNRNAYAIAVLKKSGEINETIYKWKKNDEWTTDKFDEIIDFLKEKFSNKFVFDFRDMLERICDLTKEKDNPFTVNDMTETELKRLIKRRSKREQKPSNEDVQQLTTVVLALHESGRLNNFLNALDTCAFIQSKI